MKTNDFLVLRQSSSTYFKNDFLKQEKSAFNELNLDYKFLGKMKGEEIQELVKENKKVILITNSNSHLREIPPALQEHFKSNIACLVHPNSGYDNLGDLIKGLGLYDKTVFLGNEIRKIPVFEYILGCLFHSTAVPEFSQTWQPGRIWERRLIRDFETLIIGFGNIGKYLKERLEPMVNSIDVFDPFILNHEISPTKKYDLIITVPSLTSSSMFLINQGTLTSLKPNGILINPSRGKVVEEKAIIEFAKNNTEAKIYLDVFEEEPHSLDSFREIKNFFLSSHIAGVHHNLDDEIIAYEKKLIQSFLNNSNKQKSFKGKEILHFINR